MGLFFLLLQGMVMGWLATIILQTGEKSTLLVNVVSGIGGTLLARPSIKPLIEIENIMQGGCSAEALPASLAGAIARLVAVNLLRYREMR